MKKKKEIILSILAIISLVLITIGVSYAFFSYVKEGEKENSIETGTITFLYTEVSKVGKGISIKDAYPISDSLGKAQVGEGKVFDFKITSTTPNSSGLPYEVTARKKSNSTLEEEVVKLYLTKLNGELEEEVLLEKYSNLKQTEKVDSSKYIEKTIYEGRIAKDSSNYEENFRLRMWIDEETDFSPIKGENGEDIYPYNEKEFTITVNVYANAKIITGEDKPIIIEHSSYPILTEYGVIGGTTIQYPEDIAQKLYRINNGEWKEYHEGVSFSNGDKLEVKGVYGNGVETKIVNHTIAVPTDALGIEAYDNDDDTGFSPDYKNDQSYKSYYIDVSENLWNKKINLKWRGSKVNGTSYAANMLFLNEKDESIGTQTIPNASIVTAEYEIPKNTVRIKFELHRFMNFECGTIYEIGIKNQPEVNVVKKYPTITEYGVIPSYNEVTISYFQTSIQRLYRINEGEWQEYQDKDIRLEIGDKIETKGIDKYNKVTSASSYTAILPTDALGIEAYDNDDDTGFSPDYKNNQSYKSYYIDVSKNLWNKKINLKWRGSQVNGTSYAANMLFLNEKDESIGTQTIPNASIVTAEYEIPKNTVRIKFELHRYMHFACGTVYDINLADTNE